MGNLNNEQVFSGKLLKPHAYGSLRSLSVSLPPRVAEHPLLDEAAWVALRDSGRAASDITGLVTTLETRAEFLVGAWLIDRIVPPALGGSLLDNLQPQMLKEADMLNASHFRNAVLMPRRSAKTTTLWCVLLGRCYMRPMHFGGYSMLTTAKKTTSRFRQDVYGPIVRQWPNKKERPVNVINSNGFERVEFPNGSVLEILSPNGDEVRSGAYDTLVLDEAGEAEPATWEDIIAAVVPSFDTRGDSAQLVLAGTGGKYRIGSYFWKTLHDDDAGRIRFGVPDDIDPALLEQWDGGAGELIDRLHPGLDGLTKLDKIKSNYADLGAEKFGLEYLGHFGDEHGTSTAVTAAGWKRGLQAGAPPEGITQASLAVAVHKFGAWASIGIAWHVTGPTDLASAAWELDGINTERPRVGIKLLHHQRGVDGIERHLLRFARALKTPIVYDHGTSQTRAAIERTTARARPKPHVIGMQLADVKVAHAQLLNGLEHGDVWHWQQHPLDRAAEIVVRESMGQGFLLRAPKGDENADPTPFECLALALAALPANTHEAMNPSEVWDFGGNQQDTPGALVA